MIDLDLSGRTALVTGAASGVGRAVALRYAAAGARVVAVDIDAEGLEATAATAGTGVEPAPADVRDRPALEAALADVDVDIVAAVAGVSRVGRVLDLSDDDLDLVVGVNLIGVWNTVKAALPGLLRRGPGGRIIVCGSVESVLGGEGLAAYVATKHGVLGLVKSLALELAEDGITANMVSPAGVDSEMLRTVVPPEAIDHIARTTPVPRLSTPDEVAAFFAFLASPVTSYMTGENMIVDGGLKLVNAHSFKQSWATPGDQV